MEQYIIRETKDIANATSFYEAIDTVNGVRITFEPHRFNETQQAIAEQPERFASIEGTMQLARIMREMGDWLLKNHFEKIHSSYTAERRRIGQTIQRLREERGLTKAETARMAAITRANLDNIEAGRYSVGLDILNRIASALGVSVQLM